MRRRALAALACLAAALPAAATQGEAPPRRVVSINLCTDQHLLSLADPSQIAGLSPYARDPARSSMAKEAGAYPILSGFAEDVLALKPDLVVAGTFSRRATRELLRAKGVRIEEFDVANSIDGAKREIARFGELIGRQDAAARQIAAIDAAMARARRAAQGVRATALAVQRRGWVSGESSLVASLFEAVGLDNAAAGSGLGDGALLSLEAIIAMRPDFLVVTRDDGVAEDQGRAMLLHPAIVKRYPRERIIVLPESLTVCGGATLAEALDRLSAQITAARKRS